eukprot:m.66370 g.66370  ORF g.66370 m.66370 type:complete len:198 (-) comp12113_c0_seq1:217-810(-)
MANYTGHRARNKTHDGAKARPKAVVSAAEIPRCESDSPASSTTRSRRTREEINEARRIANLPQAKASRVRQLARSSAAARRTKERAAESRLLHECSQLEAKAAWLKAQKQQLTMQQQYTLEHIVHIIAQRTIRASAPMTRPPSSLSATEPYSTKASFTSTATEARKFPTLPTLEIDVTQTAPTTLDLQSPVLHYTQL